MTSMLVGYTGFVGSNLSAAAKEAESPFTWEINTSNKEAAFDKKPELLIYAGLRAEKFLANKDPEKDLLKIEEAMQQIEKIAPKKLVLISTVDVYRNPVDVDEDTKIDTQGLLPYGKNRYELEKWVQSYKEDALIIRLPGLYGRNLKKNFIYDYIHVIPSMLKEEKYEELAGKSNLITQSYRKLDNGFYQCNVREEDTDKLKQEFLSVGFSALNFTDSRGVFQFYHLKNLWKDINIALEHQLHLLNIATQPVSVAEIYRSLSGKEFVNEITQTPPFYDYRTKYANLFGGKDGYFSTKEQVLADITKFVKQEM